MHLKGLFAHGIWGWLHLRKKQPRRPNASHKSLPHTPVGAVQRCNKCGRRRSSQYTANHILAPGENPASGTCKRCQTPQHATVQQLIDIRVHHYYHGISANAATMISPPSYDVIAELPGDTPAEAARYHSSTLLPKSLPYFPPRVNRAMKPKPFC